MNDPTPINAKSIRAAQLKGTEYAIRKSNEVFKNLVPMFLDDMPSMMATADTLCWRLKAMIILCWTQNDIDEAMRLWAESLKSEASSEGKRHMRGVMQSIVNITSGVK